MIALFWVYFLTEVCSGSVQSTSMELLPEVSVWENQRRLPLMDFNKSLLTPVDPGPWSDGNSDGNFTGTGEIYAAAVCFRSLSRSLLGQLHPFLTHCSGQSVQTTRRSCRRTACGGTDQTGSFGNWRDGRKAGSTFSGQCRCHLNPSNCPCLLVY